MPAYSFMRQFVNPIRLGLGLPLLADFVTDAPAGHEPKTQTIRLEGKRRHALRGEFVQLYFGQRTKYCRALGRSKCTESLPGRVICHPATIVIEIDGKLVDDVQAFASSDGFASISEMHSWWVAAHNYGPHRIRLVRWEPKHYPEGAS